MSMGPNRTVRMFPFFRPAFLSVTKKRHSCSTQPLRNTSGEEAITTRRVEGFQPLDSAALRSGYVAPEGGILIFLAGAT